MLWITSSTGQYPNDDRRVRYEVVDSQTGAIRGRYSIRARAQGLADRLDLVYGAVRFIVRFVEA